MIFTLSNFPVIGFISRFLPLAILVHPEYLNSPFMEIDSPIHHLKRRPMRDQQPDMVVSERFTIMIYDYRSVCLDKSLYTSNWPPTL